MPKPITQEEIRAALPQVWALAFGGTLPGSFAPLPAEDKLDALAAAMAARAAADPEYAATLRTVLR